MTAKVTNSMDGKNYPKAIDNAVERMLVEAGAMIEGDAKLLAPIDLGRLAGSITYATRKEKSAVDSPATHGDGVSTPMAPDTVYIGTNVEYAAHVEYGTRAHKINGPVKIRGVGWRYIKQHPGTKAQPFLRPAFDNNKSAIMRMGLREVDRGLKRGK